MLLLLPSGRPSNKKAFHPCLCVASTDIQIRENPEHVRPIL